MSVPSKNDKQVVKMCAGSLALDAFMHQITRHGDGFDRTDKLGWQEDDGTWRELTRHCFQDVIKNGRQIEIENTVISHKDEWNAEMLFFPGTTFPIRIWSQATVMIYMQALNIMFKARGPQIVLGPFFTLDSVLKQKLTEFLLETAFDFEQPVQRGQALWNLIAQNGGLPALCAIWEKLMCMKVYSPLLKGLRHTQPHG